MGRFSKNRRSRVIGHLIIGGCILLGGCSKKQTPEPASRAEVSRQDAPLPPGSQGVVKALRDPGLAVHRDHVKAVSGQASKLGAVDGKKGAAEAQASAKQDQAKPDAIKEKDAVQGFESQERPLYYERLIKAVDLKDRSLREFSLLRNTIFARVGNSFRKTWLDEHFRAQPWYKPLDKAQLDRLTDIDKKNVVTIVQAQEALSKQELEASQEALLAIKKRTKHQELELRLLSSRLGKWAGGKDPKRTPLEDPTLLDKTLKLSSLREMSRRDLRILRNMIYARRGRIFNSMLVDAYFHRMDWYRPGEGFKPSMLTATDRKNIRIVKSLEHSLGGPITDKDHPRDDWMYVA